MHLWTRLIIFEYNILLVCIDFLLFNSEEDLLRRVFLVGQAFSQTFSSVTLPAASFKALPDIERNNRVFSDGVGTCSQSVLQAVHEAYGQSRVLKPTLLQIRCQGITCQWISFLTYSLTLNKAQRA